MRLHHVDVVVHVEGPEEAANRKAQHNEQCRIGHSLAEFLIHMKHYFALQKCHAIKFLQIFAMLAINSQTPTVYGA